MANREDVVEIAEATEGVLATECIADVRDWGIFGDDDDDDGVMIEVIAVDESGA